MTVTTTEVVRYVVDAWWFRGLTRACMVAALFVVTWAGTVLHGLEDQVANSQALAGQVATNTRTINSITNDVSGIRTDLLTVRLDVATIKGILLREQQKDQAAALALEVQPPQVIPLSRVTALPSLP